MFNVKNHWETGKEQDVINESLFGSVNLISYKENNDSITNDDVCTEGKNLKRKGSLKRACKKKKGKYVLNEKCNEESIRSSVSMNKGMFRKLLPLSEVVNNTQQVVDNTQHVSNVDNNNVHKEPEKDEKEKGDGGGGEQKKVQPDYKEPEKYEKEKGEDGGGEQKKVQPDYKEPEKKEEKDDVYDGHNEYVQLKEKEKDGEEVGDGKQKKVQLNKTETHQKNVVKTSFSIVCPDNVSNEENTELSKDNVNESLAEV